MDIYPSLMILVSMLLQVSIATDTVDPRMIMGHHSGEVKRCKFSNANDCKILSVQDSPVHSLEVAGEFVFVGLESGELRRCPLFQASNCTSFYQQKSSINAIAVSGQNVFFGTAKGITKCGLRKSENCKIFHVSKEPIYSLQVVENYLYAGSDTILLSCSLIVPENCSKITDTTSAVNTLSAWGKHLYLGLNEGSVLMCPQNKFADCHSILQTESAIKDLDIFGNDVQYSLDSGEILRFNSANNETTLLSTSNSTRDILSIIIVYDTTPVQRHYIGESASCTWQFTSCPPYVVYYDVQSRLALELLVKDNKIYTSKGTLFDTEDVDWSHSGSGRAIFVMDSSGKMFASNKHPIGLLHHSSLMSGRPAAAAGEIKVNEGVIELITSCSGHYRPRVEFVNQVISALEKHGYEKKVTVKDCFSGMDLYIDLDYKKTDLYYRAKYEQYSRKMAELGLA